MGYVAAVARDLFHERGAGVAILLVRHDEDRLDLGLQVAVHQRHVELKLEVGERSQAADERVGLLGDGELDEQAVEENSGDVWVFGDVGLNQSEALFGGEKRALARVAGDGDSDAVKQPGRAVEHVEVAVGQRVKGAGINAVTHKPVDNRRGATRGENQIEAFPGLPLGWGGPVFRPDSFAMNLPNIITLSRIPMMFLVVWLMNQSWSWAATLGFWLFIAAAIGDWVDGYIARKRNLVSIFGKFMDALTDKIFVLGIMIAFVELGTVPIYWVLIVLCREFLISGMRMMAAAKGVVVAAERGGKTKTLTQLIAVGFLLFVPMLQNDIAPRLEVDFSSYADVIHNVGLGLFLLGVYFTVRSGWDYIVKYRAVIFDDQT